MTKKPNPGSTFRCIVACIAVAGSLSLQAQSPPAPVALGPEVLARVGTVEVTRSDYETELTRLPEDVRGGFGVSAQRIDQLLRNVLLQKLLAEEARVSGIDREPLAQRRVAAEVDKALAGLMVARMEQDAAAEFDALPNKMQLARERFAVERDKYRVPEQVAVTHILFDPKKRGADGALREAKAVRARILAGEDMGALARELSDDPSAKRNNGSLGYFGRDRMDPAFTTAAFALSPVGAVSEPVESRFGVHLIRLDGRQEAKPPVFEDHQAAVITELRKSYIDRKRAEKVSALANDPRLVVNSAAIDALVVRPDPEELRKANAVLEAPKK